MTPKQTKTVAFGSVLMLALVALAWFLGVSPQLANASKHKDAQVQAVAATETLQATRASLQQKEAELSKASREYQDLARQFPASFDPTGWLDMILAAANSSGVTVTTLAPTVPTVGAGAPSVAGAAPAAPVPAPAADPAAPAGTAATPEETLAFSTVTLTASGSPTQLRAFLRELGTMPRPILIDNAAISSAEGEGTLTLSGRTFLMRELVDPAAAAAEEAAAALPEGVPEGTIPAPVATPTTTP